VADEPAGPEKPEHAGAPETPQAAVRVAVVAPEPRPPAKAKPQKHVVLAERMYWMSDKSSTACYECNRSFTLFLRRHHCRRCGRIFCAACCPKVNLVALGLASPQDPAAPQGSKVRTCTFCVKQMASEAAEAAENPSAQMLRDRSRILSTDGGDGDHLGDGPEGRGSPLTGVGLSGDGLAGEHLDPLDDGRAVMEATSTTPGGRRITRSRSVHQLMGVEPNSTALGAHSCASTPTLLLHDGPGAAAAGSPVAGVASGAALSLSSPQVAASSAAAAGTSASSPSAAAAAAAFEGGAEASDVSFVNRVLSDEERDVLLALGSACQDHLARITLEQLERLGVPEAPLWVERLMGLFEQVQELVHPNVRGGDLMDIGAYVKVKKVASPSSLEACEGCRVVPGVVMSKHVVHTGMRSDISAPRVLLLGCSVEYQREVTKLSSLDQVLAEEEEYLRILVAKIINLSPDVVVVEHTVSRLAQELLLQEGISLVINVKRVNMVRLSRTTGASIVPNPQAIQSATLGLCDRFRVVDGAGRRGARSLMFFEGPADCLYAAILLRAASAADDPHLPSIKEVTQFGVFLARSLHLERDYLFDTGVELPPATSATSPPTLATTTLASSPLIDYPALPTTTTTAADQDQDQPQDQLQDQPQDQPQDPDHEHSPAADPPLAPTSPLHLLPYQFQSLVLIFSSHCTNAQPAPPCIPPEFRTLNFYLDSDMPFGMYLEESCFDPNCRCLNPKCRKSVLHHTRYYTHHTGRLAIRVTQRENAWVCADDAFPDQIYMWSECNEPGCEVKTPVVPMSEATYNYSFGKFLEESFYNHRAPCRFLGCSHSVHRCHTRCFTRGDLLVTFVYEAITIYGIDFPRIDPPSRETYESQQAPLRAKRLEAAVRATVAAYDALRTSLETLTVRAAQTPSALVPGAAAVLGPMLAALERERASVDDLITAASAAAGFGQVNRLMRMVWINVREWNNKIAAILPPSAVSAALTAVAAAASAAAAAASAAAAAMVAAVTSPLETTRSSLSQTQTLPAAAPPPAPPADPSAELDSPSPSAAPASAPQSGGVPHSASHHSLAAGAAPPVSDLVPLPFAEMRGLFIAGKSIMDPILLEDDVGSLIAHGLARSLENDRAAWDVAPLPPIVSIAELYPGLRGGELTAIAEAMNDDEEDLEAEPDSSLPSQAAPPSSARHSTATEQEQPEQKQQPSVHLSPSLLTPLELILRSPAEPSVKMKIEAAGATGAKRTLLFTSFFPQKFAALRELVCGGGNPGFIESIAQAYTWSASGGKSRAGFFKTLDDRYVIKRVSKIEKAGFLEFGPAYFEHLAMVFFHGLPSALVKIVGVFRVGTKQGGSQAKEDVVVMENLFYGRQIAKVFDLKGSTRNRLVKHAPGDGPSVVLQDQNLLDEYMISPFVTDAKAKKRLGLAIWNDTLLLSAANVMDYSLLTGIDEQGQVIALGIIDYLRRYTWDKQLESIVKSSAGKVPTIITPENYKRRFRDAMASSTYFFSVPDRFTNLV
jgi:hypothetical protein